ncbi:MAG TPA: prolipoprotein diacylglyceryl transferase family protein, partial [Candidatus Acidoferrum sp.]|nr:prolipoprotein diacylglyceryl transferase family protein [Candidatus Acidoferrum sp.]
LCLLILGAILPFQQRLKKRLPDGVLGLVYFAVYAAGRFFLSYYRLDTEIFFGLRQAQIASLLMVLVAVIAIPILFRRASATSAPAQATASRA